MLLELVNENHVSGWDDPRMPTISGMRRRGYSPASIRNFCKKIGVAKVNSTIPIEFLENCVREDLNKTTIRYMGVLNPLKVVINNYPENKIEEMNIVNNPEDPNAGTRKVPFSKNIFIEKEDFMEKPSKKFYRLAPGREVRLNNAYLITCTDFIKENGEIKEIQCDIDPNTKDGNAIDGRKIKATLHWVSEPHAIEAEIRLYNRLFSVENPTSQKGEYKEYLNKDSLKIIKSNKIEPAIKNLKPYERFQFLRKGYFCIDPDSNKEKIIINQTVGLRDTWIRIKNQQISK